jgi:cytoskeleton protein RodZ
MTNESVGGSRTAGAIIRAAREKQGLHIAALAASIKVTPKKLESLENDRYDELSGATFTRALAQSVCRALRIDPRPVLDLLPAAESIELGQVTGRLNAPFREKPSRDSASMATAQRSLLWAGLLLLVAAVVTYFVPSAWLSAPFKAGPGGAAAPASAVAVVPAPPAAPASESPAVAAEVAVGGAGGASAAAAAALPNRPDTMMVSASAPQIEITHSAPQPAQASVPAAAGILQLSTSESSWVEVRDAGGRILLSRTVLPGEAVGIDGSPPLRVVVGNAAVTQVMFRGRAVDVAAGTRDNVARLELK